MEMLLFQLVLAPARVTEAYEGPWTTTGWLIELFALLQIGTQEGTQDFERGVVFRR